MSALAAYDQALQLLRELGMVPQEGSTLANMAVVLNAQGQFDRAMVVAEQALDFAEKLQAQRLKVEALNALAEAALGRNDIDTVAAKAEEAIALSHTIGSKHDGGVAHRLLGQATVTSGAPFAEHFEASIELFEATKDHFELARTWAAYGTALIAIGDEIAGRAYLKQARETFVRIGANGELQRLAPIIERSV